MNVYADIISAILNAFLVGMGCRDLIVLDFF